MTDISNWREAIHYHESTIETYGPDFTQPIKRLVIPIGVYQMGHIVEAMYQMQKAGLVNGDWWGETLDIIAAAMKFAGIDKVHSNHGRVYTQEEVESRLSTYKEKT